MKGRGSNFWRWNPCYWKIRWNLCRRNWIKYSQSLRKLKLLSHHPNLSHSILLRHNNNPVNKYRHHLLARRSITCNHISQQRKPKTWAIVPTAHHPLSRVFNHPHSVRVLNLRGNPNDRQLSRTINKEGKLLRYLAELQPLYSIGKASYHQGRACCLMYLPYATSQLLWQGHSKIHFSRRGQDLRPKPNNQFSK